MQVVVMIMNISAIEHKCNSEFCYALDDNELMITLRTGKEIASACIICEDPYINGISGRLPWFGKEEEITAKIELEHHLLWKIKIKPSFKRLQYYFRIQASDEVAEIYENRVVLQNEVANKKYSKQYFKFPWLNSADVVNPPHWVKDIVWYQIMPDRFCRGTGFKDSEKFKPWNDTADMTYADFFGGNINGITEKLDYIKELGFTGIYLTPLFKATTNHKYNPSDYLQIDSDFGTEADLINLVKQAHKKGIRVMLDAVFNHCGTDFFAWNDVLKNGKNSDYFNWFFINSDSFYTDDIKTKDGRYYSFAFEANMPKLNTNNDEVIKYFTAVCNEWIKRFDIDGIRFDVGNEISHRFIKHLYNQLKAIKPDIFLLGEIWHESSAWLQGDEYDSVINYPFYNCLNDFWAEKTMDSKALMYSINSCLSMYREQTTKVLFNFLDTHDTQRVIETCEGVDVLLQKLTILMTMPGSPCVYYGTEIAMPGKCNPYNRSPMPWDEILAGKYSTVSDEFKKIIEIRKNCKQLKSTEVEWIHNEKYPRLIGYKRASVAEKEIINVIINAEKIAIDFNVKGKIIYSKHYNNNCLLPKGIIIYKECKK